MARRQQFPRLGCYMLNMEKESVIKAKNEFYLISWVIICVRLIRRAKGHRLN